MRRSGVRIPLAPPQADIRSGCRFFACTGVLLLLAPLVFRAPEGLLWGRAAWCARGRRPAREPSALRASLGASSRSPARPRRRPRAPQPGPAGTHRHRVQAMPSPTGTAARPSGALHTGGTWCTDGVRSPARPRHRPRARQPGPHTPGVLHAGGAWCTDGVRSPARPCHRPRAPQPGPPYTGVLHAGGACGAVRAGTRLEARPCPPDPPVPSTPVVPGR